MRTVSLLLLALCLLGPAARADVVVTNLVSKPQTSVRLEGKKADEIVSAFNRLKWDGTTGDRCHNPGYELRILDGDKTLVDATICFHCDNVRFTAPANYGLKGFRREDPSTAALRDRLAALFKESN